MRTVAIVAPAAHKSVHRGYFPEGRERAVPAVADVESARSLAIPVLARFPPRLLCACPFRWGPHTEPGTAVGAFRLAAARPAAETAMPPKFRKRLCPPLTLRPPQPLDPIKPAGLGCGATHATRILLLAWAARGRPRHGLDHSVDGRHAPRLRPRCRSNALNRSRWRRRKSERGPLSPRSSPPRSRRPAFHVASRCEHENRRLPGYRRDALGMG